MQQKPDNVQVIVCAALCLHNLLRIRYPDLQPHLIRLQATENIPETDSDDDIFNDTQSSQSVESIDTDDYQDAIDRMFSSQPWSSRELITAKLQRQYLTNYFMRPEGSVPWQRRSVAFSGRLSNLNL